MHKTAASTGGCFGYNFFSLRSKILHESQPDSGILFVQSEGSEENRCRGNRCGYPDGVPVTRLLSYRGHTPQRLHEGVAAFLLYDNRAAAQIAAALIELFPTNILNLSVLSVIGKDIGDKRIAEKEDIYDPNAVDQPGFGMRQHHEAYQTDE